MMLVTFEGRKKLGVRGKGAMGRLAGRGARGRGSIGDIINPNL